MSRLLKTLDGEWKPMKNKEIIERINDALKQISNDTYVTEWNIQRCRERLLWLRDDLVKESKIIEKLNTESLERKVKKLSKGLKKHLDSFDSYMDNVRKKYNNMAKRKKQ